MTQSALPFALAVDDDPLVRMDACQILEEAGFRCLEAESGDAALAVLEARAGAVTLLFTDVEMPGGADGLALARQVARFWPHVEIVVASGRVTPAEGELPEKAAFIPKPFSAELVHQELRRLLPKGKTPAPLRHAV